MTFVDPRLIITLTSKMRIEANNKKTHHLRPVYLTMFNGFKKNVHLKDLKI